MKSKHQKSGGLHQKIKVSTWKWEYIKIDFIVGFPWTRMQNYSIWLMVDRLTNYTNFMIVKSTYSAEDYAMIYIDAISSLHDLLLSIISDRGSKFTHRFWRSIQKGFGMQMK